MLHFRGNDSRFRERRHAVSSPACSNRCMTPVGHAGDDTSPACPTGVVHVLLHVEVTPHIDLDSISFICFG